MASIINSTTTNGVTVQGDNSGSLQLATNNGTTAVTIDTSQNVGIGTSSPATKTEIQGSAETLRLSRSTSGSVYLGLAQAGTRKAYLESNNADVNLFAEAASSNLIFGTVSTERGRFDASGNFQFNSGYGSVATAFGCRAWVQFVGTSGSVNASGNISSVSRTGTGDYSITFTNNMSDANYVVIGSSSPNSGYGQVTFVATNSVRNSGTTTTNTTSNFKISTLNSTSSVQVDTLIVNVAVFR